MSEGGYQSAQEDILLSTQPDPEVPSQSNTRKGSTPLPTINEEEEKVEEKDEGKPAKPKKTTRTKTKSSKAASGGDKQKLTPACASCRKSKTRCWHRHEIDKDGQVLPGPVSSPPKKRTRKATADLEKQENKDKGKEPANEVAEPATTSRRTRGRPRKRPAEELDAGENEENSPPETKRSKSDTNAQNQTASVEPAESTPPVRRKHPAEDNLSGSIWLAQQEQWCRRLGEKVKEFEGKSAELTEWQSECESMIESWKEAWVRGE